MRAKDILSKGIIPLKPDDTVGLAMQWMEDFSVSHLPVVDRGDFLGLVKNDDLYNIADIDETIDPHRIPMLRTYVYASQHFYEVLRLAASEKLSVVPVVNDKNNYIGSITRTGIIRAMAGFTSVQQPGGILILEVSATQYSLSEIARIVESNDAKVLSAFITSPPESNKLEVTVKLSVMDMSSVIQTFNRYNYVIKASFAEESQYDSLLSERYESLLKYLST